MIGLGILIIALLIVWAGSRRNLLLAIFMTVTLSIGVQWVAALACDWWGEPRYGWQIPILLLLSLTGVGVLITYVWHSELLFVMPRWVTDVRRSSAMKADVRRAVREYQVEVA